MLGFVSDKRSCVSLRRLGDFHTFSLSRWTLHPASRSVRTRCSRLEFGHFLTSPLSGSVGCFCLESAELAEKPNQKTIRFFTVLQARHRSACVFLGGVFSFRGPSARCSVFWCNIVAFILRVPFASLATLFFWTEHAFLAFFRGLGTCNFVKHDDWDWSDPRTLLGVPSQPLSGGRPLLAVSKSSRGWPACMSSSHTREARMWSPTAWAQGTRAVVRASVFLCRVLTEARVAPAVHLRGPAPLAASPKQPVGEVWQGTLQISLCPGDVESRHPCPQVDAVTDGHIGTC